jgi:hypothetical protein
MPGSKKRPPSSASSKEGFSKLFKKPRPIQSLVIGLRLTMALTLTLILTLIHPRTSFLPRSQLSQLPHWTQTRSAVLSARLQSLQTPVTLALTAPHHAMLIIVLHDHCATGEGTASVCLTSRHSEENQGIRSQSNCWGPATGRRLLCYRLPGVAPMCEHQAATAAQSM